MTTGNLDTQLIGPLHRFGGLARGRVYFDRAPIPCNMAICQLYTAPIALDYTAHYMVFSPLFCVFIHGSKPLD